MEAYGDLMIPLCDPARQWDKDSQRFQDAGFAEH